MGSRGRRGSVSVISTYDYSVFGVLTFSVSAAGIVVDGEAQSIIGQGKEIKNSKPRKEDIVQE